MDGFTVACYLRHFAPNAASSSIPCTLLHTPILTHLGSRDTKSLYTYSEKTPTDLTVRQEIGRASLDAPDDDIWHLVKVYWYTVEFGVVREADKGAVGDAGNLRCQDDSLRNPALPLDNPGVARSGGGGSSGVEGVSLDSWAGGTLSLDTERQLSAIQPISSGGGGGRGGERHQYRAFGAGILSSIAEMNNLLRGYDAETEQPVEFVDMNPFCWQPPMSYNKAS